LPAGAHDTEETKADPPAFSAPKPGTSTAFRHSPAAVTGPAAPAATASAAPPSASSAHHAVAAKTIVT